MSNSSKLKIGSPATGDHFFPRLHIRERLIRALARDHIAFLGPRRTGKTSILLDLQSHPPAGVCSIYLDLQGLRSVPAWLNLMLKETKRVLQTPPEKLAWFKQSGKATATLLKRLEQITVLGTGIKLTAGQPAVESWEPIADEFLTLLREHELPIYFETLHARLVPDTAHRALLATELDYVLETLRHDGYLVRLKDPDPTRDGLHHFASNILRDYWRHRTP